MFIGVDEMTRLMGCMIDGSHISHSSLFLGINTPWASLWLSLLGRITLLNMHACYLPLANNSEETEPSIFT